MGAKEFISRVTFRRVIVHEILFLCATQQPLRFFSQGCHRQESPKSLATIYLFDFIVNIFVIENITMRTNKCFIFFYVLLQENLPLVTI